eukprot:CAMPEP_0204894804 /NCGR_PEP_ID=MMETSP1349-20130617/33633_1 /ASSEMBLY_ACC=CAM_ASM_000710 /TAXON_ID=215587 /ORGANISM="Aplanochytrium stocchinoi, Strain GSBS06" /LENGTH=181 /DNA_ID=CAMNT_0052062033 /DNA_START=421 /DNA_END=967 /DNA_ORIENTATION=+
MSRIMDKAQGVDIGFDFGNGPVDCPCLDSLNLEELELLEHLEKERKKKRKKKQFEDGYDDFVSSNLFSDESKDSFEEKIEFNGDHSSIYNSSNSYQYMNCFLFAETDNLPSPDEDQDQGTGIDIDIDIKSGYELQVSPTEHVLSKRKKKQFEDGYDDFMKTKIKVQVLILILTLKVATNFR